jgi:hypothetical protein
MFPLPIKKPVSTSCIEAGKGILCRLPVDMLKLCFPGSSIRQWPFRNPQLRLANGFPCCLKMESQAQLRSKMRLQIFVFEAGRHKKLWQNKMSRIALATVGRNRV